MRGLLVVMGLAAIGLVLFGVLVEALTWLIVAGVLVALAALALGAVRGRQLLQRRTGAGAHDRR